MKYLFTNRVIVLSRIVSVTNCKCHELSGHELSVTNCKVTNCLVTNCVYPITHPSMSRPYDVKVSRDCLYVLFPFNNPCMLVLTLEGDMLHSLITCGEGMDVLYPAFFCLDPLNNLVLSDLESHSIRVFSPEGNLLHTIGREGHRPGMFHYPTGVAITPNSRLVCVSRNKNYDLQIFY